MRTIQNDSFQKYFSLITLITFSIAALTGCIPTRTLKTETLLPTLLLTIQATDTALVPTMPIEPSLTVTQPPKITSTPSQTATLLPSPTPILIDVGLPSGTVVYPGPNVAYPPLAWFSSPVTLTVSGGDDSGEWLLVNLTPYNQGWVMKQEVVAPSGLAKLLVVPTPGPISTATSVPVAAISLNIYQGSATFMVSQAGGTSFEEMPLPALVIDVTTAQAGQSYKGQLLDDKGRLVEKWNARTDQLGYHQKAFQLKSIENGNYVVIVTDTYSNSVQATVLITDGKEPD